MLHTLFAEHPRIMWALTIALVTLTTFNRRKIIHFAGSLLAPWPIILRWKALATQEETAAIAETTVAGARELFVKEVIDNLPDTISEELIGRVIDGIPEAMEQRALETIANLTAKVASLRKELAEKVWLNMGVHVRGFKCSADDTKEWYALIQVNTRTGQVRAHPNSEYRQLIDKGEASYSAWAFAKVGITPSTLGAPWYTKTEHSPKTIVMLGEAYTCIR